jgi:ATP-dependent helicase HrpB
VLDPLKRRIREDKVVILQAPPGAGKSTILPLELLPEPWLKGKKVIILEPRRLAAKSIASRMSQLLNEEPGKTIGYRIRFDSKISDQTKLEVVTEGILTRLIQKNSSLDEYGLVIFDEFHERNLNADLALALCLQIQQLIRPDLKILIMSATLDGEKISKRLFDAAIITSQGKQFPVELKYAQLDQSKPIVLQVSALTKKAFLENDGDVLVFLPGAGEINRTFEFLKAEDLNAEILKLYGDLSFNDQQKAILPLPSGKRKIILATASAETSLTIEGVRVVVDSGLSRVPRFEPRSGLAKLETIKVTKDSADQRAGRAGRLGPGVCYRLWAEHQTGLLQLTRKPEILESDLTQLVLELLNWGINDVHDLIWIDTPTKGAVASATELLIQLGALESGQITSKGKRMADLPTHPRIAHMLLEANRINPSALSIACDVAALLEERDPLSNNQSVDLELRIQLLHQFRKNERVADKFLLERIERLAFSWRTYFKIQNDKLLVTNNDIHAYTGLLIASAYPERISKQISKSGNTYKLANGKVLHLDSGDPLTHFEWLAIAHADSGRNEGKIFLAAPLHKQDLTALQKEYDVTKWDIDRELVVAAREIRVGGLVVESKSLSLPEQEKVHQILVKQIQENGLRWMGWTEEEEQLQARILSLQKWRANENWPDVSDDALTETLHDWLTPFLGTIYKKTEVIKLDKQVLLKSILSWDLQNQLDKLAPARIEVPSGSKIKIQYYHDARPPELLVRLQELFGMKETPAICDGKINLMIHLLSPAYRPVQVTQDLRNFWDNTYHEVRKELKSRYPKHSWPEDPWTAVAVKGARRKTH